MTNHFDKFAYDEELPAHMTDYYCERKCRKMTDYLPSVYGKYGADLGCGTGHHVKWLRGHAGARVVGFDKSHHLFGDHCVRGDILGRLPFHDGQNDFAYFINVLHHLKNKAEQLMALREAARIVKSDGLVFVQEINFLNPVIAFYVKHVFEFFYRIDQGNEYWLSPEIFREVPELVEIDRQYFTFTPDWCPKRLLPLFKKIDQWTDDRWIARFGAHVLYVFRRV